MRETRQTEDVTGQRLYLAGFIYDVSDAIGAQWIRDGRAMPIEAKAMAGAPENKAMAPVPVRKRKG